MKHSNHGSLQAHIDIRAIMDAIKLYKTSFWSIVIAISLFGCFYTLFKSQTYQYSRVIQIAGLGANQNIVPSRTVIDQIAKIIKPDLRSNEIKQFGDLIENIDVSPIGDPEQARSIVLQALGNKKKGPIYDQLFNSILNRLKEYQNDGVNLYMNNIKQQLDVLNQHKEKLSQALDRISNAGSSKKSRDKLLAGSQVTKSDLGRALVPILLQNSYINGQKQLADVQNEITAKQITLDNIKPAYFTGAFMSVPKSPQILKSIMLFVCASFFIALFMVFMRIYIKFYFPILR